MIIELVIEYFASPDKPTSPPSAIVICESKWWNSEHPISSIGFKDLDANGDCFPAQWESNSSTDGYPDALRSCWKWYAVVSQQNTARIDRSPDTRYGWLSCREALPDLVS